MSLPRLFASATASLGTALLLAAFSGGVPIAAATPPDATWKPAPETSSSPGASTPVQWSPVRLKQVRRSTPPTSGSQRLNQASTAGQLEYARPAVRQAGHHVGASDKPVAPSAVKKNTQWQLPNGQAGSGAATNRARSSTTREPRPFNAPPAVARLSPSSRQEDNRGQHPNDQPGQVTRSPRQGSAAASSAPPTSAALRRGPVTASAPSAPQHAAPNVRAASRPVAHRRHPGGRTPKSAPSRIWDTITVAFQGTEASPAAPASPQRTVEPDSLPMPGGAMHGADEFHGGHEMMDPMIDGGYPTEGYGGCADGSCPCDGPAGCACPGGCGQCGPGCGDGMCGCEPGCGCGCGCGGGSGCGSEVSCACQPGYCTCGYDNCDMNLCGKGDPESCTTLRIGVPKWQDMTLFGGVQGFKGPYDWDRDSGNFGFHEGFNTGYKVPFSRFGYQIGYRATHSQLNGDKDTDIADPHTQQFITAGVFQRAKNGLQWGIAWDFLRDERWGAVDFHQLRGEASFMDRGCHELGLSVAVHLNEHEMFLFNNDEEVFSHLFQTSDQYLLFYRFHSHRGGEGRFYGGFNDDSDGIIGADMLIPLQDRWSLAGGFTYLIPQENAGRQGASHEAWNISLALVWHYDCAARRSHSNCYRPLFNVADNGSMIIDKRVGSPAIEIDNEVANPAELPFVVTRD